MHDDSSPYDPDVVDAKAVAPHYAPPAFFYEQVSEGGAVRWVAWPRNATRAQQIFHELLLAMPQELDVLFKAELLATPDGPSWIRYVGPTTRDALIDAIKTHVDLIFRDGYTQLCVRRADGDYVVFDEYGLIFVYSNDEKLLVPLRHNLQERGEELISDVPHWRARRPDSDKASRNFADELGLERIAEDHTGV